MPNTSTLVDTFTGTLDTVTKWPDTYGGPDTTGGQARVPCAHTAGTPDYAGINSAQSYTLDSVYVRMIPAPANGGTFAYTGLTVLAATPEGTSLAVTVDTAANQIRFESNVDYFDASATVLTYSSTAHAWVRITRTGGNIVWATSPDGTTWTTRRTLAQPAWTTGTTLAVLLESYRNSGTNNYAFFDNVNTPPGSTVDATGAAPLGGITATATGVRTTTATGSAPLGALAAGGTGLVVTPGQPTAHTTQTPDNTNLDNEAPIATGVRLTTDGTRPIVAVDWWTPDANEGVYTCQLWRTDTSDDTLGEGTGTLLAETVIDSADVLPGWSRAPITPIWPTVGVLYTASVHSSSGHYVATSGAFSAEAITGGGVTLVQSGTDPVGLGTVRNGVFIVTATADYPNDAFGASNYFVDVELGDPAVAAEGAANLGGLTATGTATRTVTATGAAPLGAATATGAATRTVTGAAAAALGGVDATAAGTRSTAATGAASLGGLGAAGAATVQRPAQGAAALGGVAASGTATVTHTAQGAAPLGGLAATGAAARVVAATGSADLGGLTAAGNADTGTPPVAAAGTAPLGPLAAVAVGTRTVAAVGAAPLGALTCTAQAVRTTHAAGVATLGGIAAHGHIPTPPTAPPTGRNTAGATTARNRPGTRGARNTTTGRAARNTTGRR